MIVNRELKLAQRRVDNNDYNKKSSNYTHTGYMVI